MALFRTYDRPGWDDFGNDKTSSRSSSEQWTGSGPSEGEVPMPAFSGSMAEQNPQRKPGCQETLHPRRCKNSLPSSGSRRDACGSWSFGSEGHENGLCAGPCKDLRSGRGCTYRKKCKKCHCPHPEVSTSSIRSKRSREKGLVEPVAFEQESELDPWQQINWPIPDRSDVLFQAMSPSQSGLTSIFL
eukprot:TRINITY_DN9864_c1_g1_i2.p1 TRINITY_DN9864_c1_g1~~TRINITY_DN9864_c1_g1_i2.p1  ORF type:complete len:187 (-),score=4.37 TRINITY_DN9864_c1_g1_i2:4-564(-)